MASTRFTVDSNLLLELGERLVANRSIALAELVKNSYDADADEVRIELRNVKELGGTITVKDNGSGMDSKTVQRAWMRNATNEKKRRTRSKKYKRIITGSKGIARFACRVLSNTLILETVGVSRSARKETKEKTRLVIDWGKFSSGTDVSKIPIPYETHRVPDSTPTGTLIALENTREAWEPSDIDNLRKHLLTLISPFPRVREVSSESEADRGLAIRLEAPEFGITGPIGEEEFLKYSFGRLKGSLSGKGEPSYSFYVRISKRTATYDPEKKFLSLGLCDFTIDFFVYRSEYFKGIPLKVSSAQRKGEETGGVRIYLDNFRIFPYGEPRDDWLSLDERRGKRLTEFEYYKEETESIDRSNLARRGGYSCPCRDSEMTLGPNFGKRMGC
ncbi:MAG: ATP-binding protein [Candidatus Bathyarchaeota archaeon]|nr:ATP-binding protein [Candidatus Bathyarchaeota archaeon]